MPIYSKKGKLWKVKVFRIGRKGSWYAKNADDALSISYIARAQTRSELEQKLRDLGYVQEIR